MNDDELDDLIRQTHPKPEFPSSFQRDTWARIAVVEQRSWSARWQEWSESLFGWMARPTPAVAAVSAMLVLGAVLGHLTTPDNPEAGLRAAYVTSINPVAAARLAIPRP